MNAIKSILRNNFRRLGLLLLTATCIAPPLAGQASGNNPAAEPSCTDYYYGVGVERSVSKAFQCFQDSADGKPDYIWLIMMTLNGEGTPQSLKSARELLEKAKKGPTHVADVGILEDSCCDADALEVAEQVVGSAGFRSRFNICDFTAGTNNLNICMDDFEGILNSKHDLEFKQIAAKLRPTAHAVLEQVKKTFDELTEADFNWKLDEYSGGTGYATFAEDQRLSDELDFASLLRKVVRDRELKVRSAQEYQSADDALNKAYRDENHDENGKRVASFESAKKAQLTWLKLEGAWKKLCEELYRGEMPAPEIDRAIATELREVRTLEIQGQGNHDYFAAGIPEVEHFDRGFRFLNDKNWDGAIREYSETIRLNPENGAAHGDLGWALENKKDWDGAIREYREAVRINPEDADAFRGLGQSLENKKDLDGAIAEYRKAIAVENDWIEGRKYLAAALRSKGDLDGSIPEYREIVRLTPNDSDAHRDLAWALLQKSDYDAAIVEYRDAVRLQPDSPGAHGGLAWALEQKKDWDAAAREYRETIRLSPDWADAHNDYADVLVEKGDYDGAISECRTALRLDPKLAGAHVNIGNALHKKGDHDGAIAEFREAIRIAPDYATAHGNLAWMLEQKGDHDGAIQEYREVVRLAPKDAQAHNGLAQALENKGEEPAAMEEYSKASGLDPKNQEYRDSYERLREKLKK